MNEIYLYSQIYDFVAEDFCSKMEELQGQDVVIRACSPGGSVFAGWGIIAKMQEHTGKVKIKCDGLVASMMLYIVLFCEDVEALDVTSFVLHRANMYVGDPADQEFLNGINAKLQEKLTKKIDAKKLKELKGVSIKDIFNPEGTPLDVNLTADEARQIGLIKNVKKMTPAVMAEYKTLMARFNPTSINNPPILPNPQNPDKMTLAELQQKHPDLYAQVIAMGAKQELERVQACLVYNEIDPDGVKAIIASGIPMTVAQVNDFNLKAIQKGQLANIGKDSPKAITTEEVEAAKTEKTKNILAFENEVNANLKLTTVK